MGERLVKILTRDFCPASNLAHALRPGNIAKCSYHKFRIMLFHSRLNVSSTVLGSLKLRFNVPII